MNDFSIPGVSNEFGFPPSPANYIRAFKRPLSSVAPIIAAYPEGTLFAAIGAAGGSRIISATALCLWHAVEHDMTLKQALRVPRLHDQVFPNNLLLEYPFNNDTADGLIAKGHNVTWVREGLSSVQGVKVRSDGTFEAASEPRQKNSAGLTI